ncbi:MAG TPA: hypothetical protein VEK08_04895 [Planctomycetota bacterium]|nr:hypothetical protein [Planctomycetota bacterium]
MLRGGLFHFLSDRALLAVAERAGERDLTDSQLFMADSESGGIIVQVISGTLELYLEDQCIGVVAEGETAQLPGENGAYASARGPVQLLFLKEKALHALVREYPDVAVPVFRLLHRRIAELNGALNTVFGDLPQLGLIEGTAGDVTGQKVSLRRARTVLGKSISPRMDVLTAAFRTNDTALLREHATITVKDGAAYIEPRQGELAINGSAVRHSLILSPDDQIWIGTLAFRIVLS